MQDFASWEAQALLMEWSEKGNPGSSSLLVLKNNLGSISVLLRAFQLGTGEEKKVRDIVLRFAYLRLFHQDGCHVHEPSPEGQILGRSKYHLIQIFETIIADQAGVLPVVVGNIWRKLMILFL
ncbi:hypothetical protein NC653_026367 [Populus alba x Populus x berolinensis]|uniref:Uncharacterized protein n=1 Tax=Populus alba x Populus x berolinensis TaxID=444605 RepID=A0AAD6Q932_9ROSI|nr:hypothetical protein NC653_026367 [Populus alba x Populus x berolinensis]